MCLRKIRTLLLLTGAKWSKLEMSVQSTESVVLFKVVVFVIHLLRCSSHYLKKILKFETIILKLLVKSMFPTFVLWV